MNWLLEKGPLISHFLTFISSFSSMQLLHYSSIHIYIDLYVLIQHLFLFSLFIKSNKKYVFILLDLRLRLIFTLMQKTLYMYHNLIFLDTFILYLRVFIGWTCTFITKTITNKKTAKSYFFYRKK